MFDLPNRDKRYQGVAIDHPYPTYCYLEAMLLLSPNQPGSADGLKWSPPQPLTPLGLPLKCPFSNLTPPLTPLLCWCISDTHSTPLLLRFLRLLSLDGQMTRSPGHWDRWLPSQGPPFDSSYLDTLAWMSHDAVVTDFRFSSCVLLSFIASVCLFSVSFDIRVYQNSFPLVQWNFY